MKKNTENINDTRSALLKAAEDLFFTHGFDGVSVRQITRTSGANVASVNYHFKDKTGLFIEVLASRIEQITQEKLALLDALDKQEPTVTLEEILNAYIGSFFAAHKETPYNDRLTQIIYREMGPDAVTGGLVAERLAIPINRALKKSILKTSPELDEEHVSYCVSSITGQVIHFIRSREVLRKIHGSKDNEAFIEEVIDHITQFSLRGLGSKQHV